MKASAIALFAGAILAGCATTQPTPKPPVPPVAPVAGGVHGSVDPRVAPVLASLGYTYEMTGDNDYKLVFEIDDEKRTQLVVVNSNTETYGKAEFREVWSPALLVDDPIDPALAQRLLRANDSYKLGAWRVWPADPKDEHARVYVVFVAQIDANAPADMLSAALDVVSQTADELEAEVTHADAR